MASNSEQIANWNGPSGETWVRLNERLDRQLSPLGRVAMDALAPRPGERVLDVGCGAGQTTIELAARVGPTGQVVGVDVSEPMLAGAQRRAPDLTFIVADAQVHAFDAGSFDAVFSRFGVMFFADPVGAFANLATALVPGGRLAFVCWRPPEENPALALPLTAAVAAGLPAPAPMAPDAPGPFSLADRDHIARILSSAGFRDIAIEPHDDRIGGSNLEDTVDMALSIGPLSRALREHPALREKIVEPVRAALAAFLDRGIVNMPSATWIVTARR